MTSVAQSRLLLLPAASIERTENRSLPRDGLDRRLVDRVEDEDRLVRARVGELVEVAPEVGGVDRRRVFLERPLTAAALDADEDARAPLEIALEPCAQIGEPVRRVAVPRVPAVPPVHVRPGRGHHPGAGRSDEQRDAAGGLRTQQRVRDPVVAAFESNAFAGEEAADDLERLLEARDPVVERDPERPELRLVPAGAKAEDEAAAGDLVDRDRKSTRLNS